MPKQAGPQLWGHGLVAEGRVRVPGSWNSPRNGTGRGTCGCGMESPELPSTAKRKQWHRDHKDDIRAGGTGKVWEGGKP